MARAKAKPVDAEIAPPVPEKLPVRVPDEFSPTVDADLEYIPPDLRYLAVRADSLSIDPLNLKDHGEADLPSHQASLREFGIRRAVVVRRSNRQIEAGNGTVQAALRNGWEYVPVIFIDEDQNKARAFAAADNMVATLAHWNDVNLQKLADESPALFDDPDLSGLAAIVLEGMEKLEVVEETAEQPEDKKPDDIDVMLSHRVIAAFDSQDKQIEFLKEMKTRGIEARLNTVQVK